MSRFAMAMILWNDSLSVKITENHKKEHAAFVAKVSGFKDGLEKGKLSLTIEVVDFLSDWLKKHIMGTDKKYSSFLNDKGLK